MDGWPRVIFYCFSCFAGMHYQGDEIVLFKCQSIIFAIRYTVLINSSVL